MTHAEKLAEEWASCELPDKDAWAITKESYLGGYKQAIEDAALVCDKRSEWAADLAVGDPCASHESYCCAEDVRSLLEAPVRGEE